jgi:hypothetical protein
MLGRFDPEVRLLFAKVIDVSSFLLTRYIPPFFFEAFLSGCF